MGLGLAAVLAAMPVAAQTGQVVGTVRDAGSLQPLEAAQVYVAGAGLGTLTNAAGRFVLLNVPVGEVTLVAELVGRRSGTQIVTVVDGEAAVADFELEQTAIALDQIVVTGAGVATERRKLGNTIATIDPASLADAPINDFSQLIAGREPGVVALPSSGVTGEGARIRIRGSSSLSQLNEPIIYVDGIRVDRSAIGVGAGGQGNPSRLDDIPPDAIERVEILKGAAAATLYGTEASNGVIQIFTKKGRAGAPRFSLQTEFTGVTTPMNRIEPHADFARDATEAARINSRFGLNVQPYEAFQQDIIPDFFSTGFAQSYSASVSGGSQAFQYFVSGRYQNEDGPQDTDKAFTPVPGIEASNDINRRFQATTSFTLIPSDKIRVGVSTLYAQTTQETPDNANNIYGVFSSALMAQLRKADDGNLYGAPAFATLRENMYQHNTASSTHVAGSITAGFTPTETFRLDGTFGFDFTSDDVVNFRPYRWNVDDFSGSSPDGSRQATERRSRDITADLKGSWTSRWGEFENVLLFGGQGFIRQSESAGGGGQDFPGLSSAGRTGCS
jgi:TonB-dependent SusC/RagA subfamily outer membrane receptor